MNREAEIPVREENADRPLGAVRARDVAVAACAASALVHAVLAPEHFSDHPLVAISFAVAACALLWLALALTRPGLRWAPLGGAVLFAALIVAYPVVHLFTDEGTDALGVGTKLVEAVGVVACLRSVRDQETSFAPIDVITGVFVAMILLSFGHDH
jgi:hypothetical protein